MSHLWRTIKSSISALRNSEDLQGKAFIIAADTGDLDKMLDHIGKRGVSYQDEYGQRPLHRASRRGHAAAVRMLLEYGTDPNATDHVGAYTAIQYAAHYQHSEVVRLLVSYGADVYYQNRIACKPATYYAHKYAIVGTAIQQGTSDLYIHRSIAASFLVENIAQTYFTEPNASLSLKHSIGLLIVEFLPRHQLWTQVKTRYITNATTNWHSSDLFSEKHLEDSKRNKIHSCQYHGEFDLDKDWEHISKIMEVKHEYSDSDCECFEEEKYREYSDSVSRKSLSEDSDECVEQRRIAQRKRKRRRRDRQRRVSAHGYNVRNNVRIRNRHTYNNNNNVRNWNVSDFRIGIVVLLLSVLFAVFISLCLKDIELDFETLVQIIKSVFSDSSLSVFR